MAGKWRAGVRNGIRKYGLRWALGLLLTCAAVLYTMGLWSSHTIERQDTIIADTRLRLERPVLDPRIVIVDIDPKSLNEVGRFPWSRNVMAKLVDQLVGRYHAAAVGFDVSFPEPDTSSGYAVLEQLAQRELKGVPAVARELEVLKPTLDYDGLFAQALKGRPVVLGYNISQDLAKGALPPPLFTVEDLNGRVLDAISAEGYEANLARLQEAASGAGIFTVLLDDDGLVRSAPLLMRIGNGYYPSLSVATAAAYLKARAIKPYYTRDVDSLNAAELQASGADYISILTARRQYPIASGDMLRTTVQFRGPGGPAGGSFRYLSAVDVLKGRVPAKLLDQAIVLVGTTAPGLQDLRATPVNASYPGVEVHANMIKSILDQRFKTRPDFAFAIELLQVLAAGLLLAFVLPILNPVAQVLLASLSLVLVAALNFAMYTQMDWTLDMFVCLLLIGLLFVLNLAWGFFFEFRKGRALVSRFGEYVAPELVAQMAENPEAYNMDGESRELSVMFVDVRGFTTISEGLSPKELREYINLYLTAMSEDIRSSHQGTLDKYIGDAVMAFWGAPVAFADHASRAVATSLLMQASSARLNADFIQRGWPELKIGIGINSGLMHVGDMGSAIRRAYTVMGDAVNLGSRLEGITKVYGVGIAVGEATRLAAPEFVYRELDLVRVKGKNEPVAIFEPLGKPDQLAPDVFEELGHWDQALALVRAQAWDEAEDRLRGLAALYPERGLYALYLERLQHFRQHPPGAAWDGVTTFDTK